MSNKFIGGIARALSLSSDKRKQISKKASKASAKARKNYIRATHEGILNIGEIEINCYVLQDGRRMIGAREIGQSLGYSGRRTSMVTSMHKRKSLEIFFDEEAKEKLNTPIKVKTPRKTFVDTYDSSMLVELCEAILKSRDQNSLTSNQKHIAIKAEQMLRAFAKTGITALIDEATGYQYNRASDALSKILNAFISEELQPYVSMFPSEFYQELLRLRGLDYLKDAEKIRYPRYFGHLVSNITYRRLAPGVYEELKAKTPVSLSGYKLAKYFQSLTPEKGMKALISHLGFVIALMKVSENYEEFMERLDKLKPIQPSKFPELQEEIMDIPSTGL